MRFFAILTMLIAWLFYGAMPALANCPICDAAMAMPAVSDMPADHVMADMPGMSMADHASMGEHPSQKQDNPCAGGMAHAPSCAACLAIAPSLSGGDDAEMAFFYPAPDHGPKLLGSRPAPTAPPPRFA
ncbi:MAG: hypothetical protein KGI75_15955 [Rhizobiaceae bacterium]|nr:hypothetical protein [Rhizobiaceae bacterium]